jgi:hypothetical protein
MELDFSRLNTSRVLIGGAASILLIISILFLPWYSVDLDVPQRIPGEQYNPDAFICGEGESSCTGWETFPILRWLLLAAAAAPLILGWILVRGHRLSWAPGEMTMVAGFAAAVLIAYNGLLDRPGTSSAEIGVGLDYGYWIALLAAIVIAGTGFTRSLESGGRKERKAPGTV